MGWTRRSVWSVIAWILQLASLMDRECCCRVVTFVPSELALATRVSPYCFRSQGKCSVTFLSGQLLPSLLLVFGRVARAVWVLMALPRALSPNPPVHILTPSLFSCWYPAFPLGPSYKLGPSPSGPPLSTNTQKCL